MLLTAIFIGLLQLSLMLNAVDGNLFSSYAYITDDGFDWVTQGTAFNQLLSGLDNTAWPWIRPPIYVFVTAMDDLFGGTGRVIIAIQSLAVMTTAYVISVYAHNKGFSVWISALLALGWYLSYFGEVHLYILSDTLASCLLTISTFLAIYYFNQLLCQPDRKISISVLKQIFPLIFLSLAAGLTQTYGLIPVLIISFVYGLYSYFSNKNMNLTYISLAFILLTSIIFIFLKLIWENLIPHTSKPDQFALLSPSFKMWEYYDMIWSLAFCSFIPVIYVIVFHIILKKKFVLSAEKLSLLAICSAFAFLSFIYQWKDPRFTFIYLPVVVMTILNWCEISKPKKSVNALDAQTVGMVKACVTISGILLIMSGQLLHPKNRWNPNLTISQVVIDPSKGWVLNGFNQTPKDRLHLQEKCGNTVKVCDESYFKKQWSGYSQRMHADYVRRSKLKSKEPLTVK